MSNYTKLVNFAAKDSLPSGDAGKLIKGTEINTELNNIQTAVNSKADSNSSALTGTPTAPTAAAGTNTTQIATTAYVYNLVGGLTATPAELNVLDGITATTAELNVLDGITATTAELNYVDGVTSNIQTQLDAITGGSTSGTVTSVGVSVPTGLSVSGSPVTSSGTIALSFTSGYSIPTTAKQTNWDTAYGWGDHSTQGYLTSFTESDPTVPSHVKSITTTNVSNWNTAYGWGDHSTEGYLTSSSLTGYATESYVGTEIASLVDSAPATLDTLNELAAALGDDPNFATTVTNSIAGKLDDDYRELPQVAKDATYTFVASDSGKHIYHSNGTAYTWTIPPNSSVAFPIGTVITVVNDASADVDITVARGSGVALVLSGTDQNCTVGQYGIATLLKVGTDRWLINGSGVA